ncbi:MAG: LysR family transcriptional regulator [Myxococcales bacterium]|nr:MAG: LysR family transcriptional regulator [Myxococcales bacterium]
MYHPGLNDLDAVLAVARRSAFRGAALDLGMSTTALSSSIAKLEAHLGVRLFHRTTRSVSLTDAGRAFVEQVAPGLEGIRGAMDAARSRQARPSGTLRINTFAMAAREILAPLVLEYLRRHPDVHVDVVTEGRLVDIVADGFDFGVRMADLVPTDMIAIPLGKPQRHAIVASPAYLKKHGRPRVPPDLLGHRCVRVRLPNGSLFRWELRKRGQTAVIDVTGPLTLDESSLSLIAVRDGIGLGYFMEPDVRGDIEAGRLVRVLEDWTPELAPLCLYYPGRRNASAAHKAFVALTREVAAART